MKPRVSIVIVNFNVRHFLHNCLKSIYAETGNMAFEVIVVDNNSCDESVSMVKQYFPQVFLIENMENVGFARANNQAFSSCAGEYVLLLNPDTVILDNAIEKTVRFMDENFMAGIAGCRVLNKDGSMELACRRTIPTPSVAFFRMIGLSRLFPKSRLMAKYNLTYLDADQSHEVDSVSGAFLMIRRSVMDEIGGLDEIFFMYGEELDWCLRVKKSGWKVMYYSGAKITHYKGECSRFNSRKATFEFHRSMHLFHKKHFAEHYSFLINSVIYMAIYSKMLISCGRSVFSTKVGSRK